MTTEGRYQTTDARALWFCSDCGAVVPVEARGVHDEWHERLGLRRPFEHGGGGSVRRVCEHGHTEAHIICVHGGGLSHCFRGGYSCRGPSLQGTGEEQR